MSNNDSGFTLKQWIDAPVANFDKSAEYAQHIQPIVDQLVAACKQHGVPMTLKACYQQDQNGTMINSVATLPNDPSMVAPQMLVGAMIEHPNQEGVITMLSISEAASDRFSKHIFGKEKTKH